MIEPNYTYRAKVVSVYDGDTCRVDIDCGFSIEQKNVALRLYGINAPELRGDTKQEGMKSRDYLINRILHKEVIIKTFKDTTEKYGRYLAIIYINGSNVNQEMTDRGLAEVYLL